MSISFIVSKIHRFSLGKSLFLALVLCINCDASADATKVLLSTEEKVGQVFIFGVRGQQVTPYIQKRLREFNPGGIIFFKKNISSLSGLSELTTQLQKSSKTPLLTMLDQEGGSVSRLPLGFIPPTAWSLGQSKNPDSPLLAGQYTGEVLKDLGIHLNLAPVYDISSDKTFAFLGTRVFSNDVKLGSTAANAFSKGLINAHVIPTAKHFPGHGFATGDSHKILPESQSDLELSSFQNFFSIAGTKAVMMAHVSYPQLDPAGTPASLSYPIVTQLLREKLQYNGLVITDDLEMSGASRNSPLGERVIQAFEAGCDMLMIAWSESSQKIAYRALLEAVKSGRISQQRLDQSVARILTAKQSVIVNSPTNHLLGLKKLKDLTRLVAQENFQQSITGEMPLPAAVKNIVVFSADSRFYNQFSKEWKKTPSKFYRLQPSTNLSDFKTLNPNSLFIYYVSGPGSARILQSLPKNIRAQTVIVNATHPGFVQTPKEFRAIFQMSTPFYKSGSWMAQWLEQKLLEPVFASTKPQD